jgi:transposase-like protein
MSGGRRRRTAAEKLRIVLAGMEPSVEVSDLCRREGINPAMYYLWKKKLVGSASVVFGDSATKSNGEVERLQAELARMKGVVAEITAENLELKKGLSG